VTLSQLLHVSVLSRLHYTLVMLGVLRHVILCDTQHKWTEPTVY